MAPVVPAAAWACFVGLEVGGIWGTRRPDWAVFGAGGLLKRSTVRNEGPSERKGKWTFMFAVAKCMDRACLSGKWFGKFY